MQRSRVRMTSRTKMRRSQIKLVWAAVVLLGMLVHNNWQIIAIEKHCNIN